MDKLNELGFVNFWGVTPALNMIYGENKFLNEKISNGFQKIDEIGNKANKDYEISKNQDDSIDILIINSLDIRHILKTLEYLIDFYIKNHPKDNISSNEKKITLNFFFHENFKENLVRLLVFLDLILSNEFNNTEKCSIFLEIYGNTYISEKANTYLHNLVKKLTDIIYLKDKEENVQLQSLVNLNLLDFKTIDELSEILESYHNKVEFNIDKLREERLRYLFKDRYDYRENLIDWDYQMKTTKFVDFMGYSCYKRFRLNGISFFNTITKYNKPNKTLSSYIPGRSVKF